MTTLAAIRRLRPAERLALAVITAARYPAHSPYADYAWWLRAWSQPAASAPRAPVQMRLL